MMIPTRRWQISVSSSDFFILSAFLCLMKQGGLTFDLGMYGDVMRVKILYHKLDTAMVQYSDNMSAVTGQCLLPHYNCNENACYCLHTQWFVSYWLMEALTSSVSLYVTHLLFTACKYLDRAVFWENEIRVIQSKHSCISMPSPESNRVSPIIMLFILNFLFICLQVFTEMCKKDMVLHITIDLDMPCWGLLILYSQTTLTAG